MGDRKIRLLFLSREEFPISRVDVDVLFGREIIGRGHKVDLVIQAALDSPSGSVDWYGSTAFVGRTVKHGLLAPFLRHWYAFWHDMSALRRLRSMDYDAVQFRDKFLSAVIGTFVARARGVKCFFWLSFPYPESDLLRAKSGDTRFPLFAYWRGVVSGWLLYRWIVPRADHVFLQSDRMREEFIKKGHDGSRLTAVPMGIDLRDISMIKPRPRDFNGREVVVGYLGVLDTDRHLTILIDMLSLLRKGGMPARLLLIGDSKEVEGRELIESRARELGIAQFVEITGFLPRVQAMQKMQEADIAVSPIYPSPMFLVASPTKLVEYMAMGIPVVANQHPEQRRILRESRAGVCAPWSARQFARSVRWWTRLDPKRRATRVEQGREWVGRNRTYQRIGEKLEQKYLELLAVQPRDRV